MNYFKESEFECCGKNCFNEMNKKFICKLEKARSFSLTPYVINSSWRSEEHNKKVGGSKTSSHLKGLAIDIAAPTSSDKYEIIKSLLRVFTRVGIGSNFVHVDMDYEKPQYLIWTY